MLTHPLLEKPSRSYFPKQPLLLAFTVLCHVTNPKHTSPYTFYPPYTHLTDLDGWVCNLWEV